MPGIWILLCIGLSLAVCLRADCPRYQVPHTVDGRTRCCKPVFKCPVDHEIHFCDRDEGEDVCRSCPGESVNKYVTSSLDEVHHSCFNMTSSHQDCPIQETLPVRDPISCDSLPCRCKEEDCRYGDVCFMCKERNIACGENEEMNATGDCVPCKPLMRSPAGCGPCQYVESLWRLQQAEVDGMPGTTGEKPSKKVTKMITTAATGKAGGAGYMVVTDTSTNATKTTDQGNGEKKESGISTTAVVIIIAACLFIGLAIALLFYIKRRIRNGDETSKLVVWYRKISGWRNRNNGGNGQQNVGHGANGDVQHDVETALRPETEPKVQTVKPFLRQDDENGACGGVDPAHLQLLKDPNEETSEKQT